MDAVFLKLLNLSISASWLIAAVVLVRFLLKNAPKRICCVLWALVAVRLLCPFSVESAWSLIPSRETIPEEILYYEGEQQHAPARIKIADNPLFPQDVSLPTEQSVSVLQTRLLFLPVLWLIGTAGMLAYALLSFLRLKRSVRASIPAGGLYVCDEVLSPFLLGILRPRIYVPSSMTGETLACVTVHERAHIRRLDHLWKPLGFLLLTVHWFNPLCWLAYVLFCRDMEMACDETVIRDMDRRSAAEYSQALLDCSLPRRRVAACPVAFGEVGVKARVKAVLRYKKPAFLVAAIAAAACIAVALCFLTDPKTGPSDRQLIRHSYASASACALVNQVGIEKADAEVRRAGETADVLFPVSGDRAKQIRVTSTLRDGRIFRQETVLEAVGRAADAVPAPSLSFSEAAAYAGWTGEAAVFLGALNANTLMYSAVCHLPIYRFGSADELESFSAAVGGTLSMEQSYDEVPSFRDAAAPYGEGFFRENDLLLTYVQAGSGSYRFGIQDVVRSGSVCCVQIARLNDPEICTADMAGWFLLAAVKKADLEGCTVFDAQLR